MAQTNILTKLYILDSKKSDVLIIIPVYNESENIKKLILELKNIFPEYDILVVDDASTDKSGEIAESTNRATIIHLPINLGIGGCVQTGYKYARKFNYNYALQFDGDGQHKVEEINKLIKPLRLKEADVVIGSRFNIKHNGFKSDIPRRIGIKIFELLSYLLIRQHITDHTSGFRSYNKKAINFLADNYPTDFPEPEVIILLGRNNFVIKEVFTQMLKRQGGVSSISLAKGPYYMMKVILSMFMASMRSRIVNEDIKK